MTKANLVTLTSVCAFAFFLSCKHEIPEPATTGGDNNNGGTGTNTCDPNKVYFQNQVLPILVSNCTMSGCHNDASKADGVVLTSYEKVMATAEIEPGKPAESKIYKMITEDDEDKRMPLGKEPLPAEQIDLIYQWIQQGAKNETCTDGTCSTSNITYSTTIKTIIRDKCQGCHNGASSVSGIDLTTYTALKAKVDDGRLWGAINHLPGYSPMPKGGAKLSDCEIDQIEKWISDQAPNN